MRASRTSPPEIPSQTCVSVEPAAPLSGGVQPGSPPDDDAVVGLLRRILSVTERCAERTAELENRLRQIEKLQSRTAAGQRLGLNLGEAAEVLGLDQRVLRPLLNDASKTKIDPNKLNFIPKGNGSKTVKWIPRDELDRFAKQWWRDGLAGSHSPTSEESPTGPGASDAGVAGAASGDERPLSESSDRGAA